MYSFRNVGELIVGNASASQTTVPTFLASATDKQIKVLSKDGTIATAGKPFYVLQKAANAKGGFEFSDVVDPKHIERITLRAYAPEVAGVWKVDGFTTAGVIAPQRTYEIEVCIENELSPENFDIVQGYYVTGAVLGSDTATTVRNGLIASLNQNLKLRGGNELTVTSDGTGILLTEVIQSNVPGKIDGRKLLFRVRAKVFSNVPTNGQSGNLDLLTVTQVTAPNPGNGTGKWATNLEWFVKGQKYDDMREGGWPADFADLIPYYTTKTGIYNVIQIVYFTPRTSTNVERQYKVLTILVEKASDTLANNAATNAVLTDIRTAVSTFATVPANLATA